jgi:cysteine desulfuration protein SufE
MFDVDSDAHIVKGLLAVVLAAFNGKSAKDILDFDVESYFGQLDLVRHLSPSRGNGLRAMVQKINQAASESLS